MKSHLLRLLALLALALAVAAWTKEDHEIFRLRDEVIEHEGDDATFYSFMQVSPSATFDDIEKANRKRSRQLHPDKAIPSLLAKRQKARAQPGSNVPRSPSNKERSKISKEATARYQRLSVVANILKSSSRERYDHFLRNGFPAWRGTGYYYARFRPGLGSVLVGLGIVFGGAVHYAALYVGWKRHRDFVQRYVTQARKMAWGNESGVPGVPGLDAAGYGAPAASVEEETPEEEPQMALNRKQKRAQEKAGRKKDSAKPSRSAKSNGISKPVAAEPIEGPQGSKKKVVAENGKVLIVDSVGNVFLEETTAEGEKHEYLLDPNDIPAPTIFQTALFRLPIWAYSNTLGRVISAGPTSEPLLAGGEDTALRNTDDAADELLNAATPANPKGEARRRKAKSHRAKS